MAWTGSGSGDPLGSQSSSDRAYGYQRRSRPRRSCRRPAVIRLPWTVSAAPVLVRSATRAACQQRGGIRIFGGRVPLGVQQFQAGHAALPPGQRLSGQVALADPGARRERGERRRAQCPGGPAGQVGVGVEAQPGVGDRPTAISQARRPRPRPAPAGRREGRTATAADPPEAPREPRAARAAAAGRGSAPMTPARRTPPWHPRPRRIGWRPSALGDRPSQIAGGACRRRAGPRRDGGPGPRPAPDHGSGRATEEG